jgi:PilZ domain-containing protein
MAESLQGRLFPRMQMAMQCQISEYGDTIEGITRDISWNGIAVSLLEAIPPGKYEPVRISLQEPIVVSALPVHTQAAEDSFIVGFQIASIEAGEQEWKQLNMVPQ